MFELVKLRRIQEYSKGSQKSKVNSSKVEVPYNTRNTFKLKTLELNN